MSERQFSELQCGRQGLDQQQNKPPTMSEEQERLVTLYNEFPESKLTNVPARVVNAVISGTLHSLGDFRLRSDNFSEPLTRLVQAEQVSEQIHLRKYDKNPRLVRMSPAKSAGVPIYNCAFHGLSKGVVSFCPGDQLVINDDHGKKLFEIVWVKGDLVGFRQQPNASKPSRAMLKVPGRYRISFIRSGMILDRCIEAIKKTTSNQPLMEMLFPPSRAGSPPQPRIDYLKTWTAELSSRLDKLDSRQKRAVRRIIEAICRPYMYLIFGPPGTGKTVVLVEAVVQIYARDPAASILICSSSNTVVEDLASMIHETALVKSLVHVCSAVNQLSPRYCASLGSSPPHHRVVLSTNLTAYRIERLFDYVFIDEAGHSTLPEALIPANRLKCDGLLVLAGDPKQLGPVVKNEQARKYHRSLFGLDRSSFGLDISLLDHARNSDIYLEDDPTEKQRFYAELVTSYRSDKRIMKVVSALFYDHGLVCQERTPQSLLDKLQLPHPLVFKPVEGREDKPTDESTSFTNHEEAVELIDFLFKLYEIGLTPNQVGIITPYKVQKSYLTEVFEQKIIANMSFQPNDKSINEKKNLKIKQTKKNGSGKDATKISELKSAISKKLCKIDTVDSFQGSERDVILVSTVRTTKTGSMRGIGFLTDCRRFNVTMSRAKHLLVVFGHPLLREIPYWKDFVKLAEKGAMSRPSAESDKPTQKASD